MSGSPEVPRSHLPAPVVPSDAYNEEYFRDVCLGHEEWSRSGGAAVAGVYPAVLRRAALREGETVVDIGTGRGELLAVAVAQGARRAIGFEYATAGAKLARQTLVAHDVDERASVLLADARAIPLRDRSADLVTMVDVVEHLASDELDRTLRESLRILRPGGRIVVHTMPNRSVYEITYRIQRLLRRDRRAWPVNPRNRFELEMHVNEQTVTSLARALRRAGFSPARASLGRWVYTDFVPTESGKRLYRFLARLPLLDRLGVGDLWGEGTRPPAEAT